MGAFVLGILVGWLLEWVFFTFWAKRGDDEDCSTLKAELELKNRQISSLQTQLSSVSENSSGSDDNLAKKTKATSKANQTKTNTTKAKSRNNSSSTTNKTTNKSVSKSKTKASVTKAKSKPKTTTTKSKSAVSTNKTTRKKASTTAKRNTKASGDDFTKLSGIGPSMSATLKTLGIDTFEKLAATEDDILRDLLESSGARMNNNKDVMDSWNEQATLAAKGDFAGLKRLQVAIKK